jgi:predicted  nucleic acid-binding Zn-ribbon protein
VHPDLERLVKLQALDLELQRLTHIVENEAERRQAMESALDQQRSAVAAIRERANALQNDRRVLEKDLAQVQGRLSKYKDQLMEVKTNKEYHAMQTEIATAEAEVRKHEDRILEAMVDGDTISTELRDAEKALAGAETQARTNIARLGEETAAAQQQLTAERAVRDGVARGLPPATLSLYQTLTTHRGLAVVEARDGHCSACHVRLRPKVYQEVRRNDTTLRCDSCGRILYYVPPRTAADSAAPPPTTGS